MDVTARQINVILQERFGVEVDFSCSLEELRDLMQHYTAKREAIVEKYGNDAAVCSAEYVKSHLISEAVRVFLREIAPRRLNRIRRNKS